MVDSILTSYLCKPAACSPHLFLKKNRCLDRVHLPPRVVDNVMYLSLSDGAVEARHLDGGQVLWRMDFSTKIEMGRETHDGIFLVAENYLLVEYGDELFVIDNTIGELKSATPLNGKTLAGASLAPPYVYTFRADEELNCSCVCWDFVKQNICWETPLTGYSEYITLSDGLVLLASGGDTCFALRTSDGSRVWECKLTDMDLPSCAVRDEGQVTVASPLIPIENSVLIGVYPFHLVSLSRESGAVCWTRELKVMDVGRICCNNENNAWLLSNEWLYCINGTTGEILLERNLESTLSDYDIYLIGQPALAKDFLFLVSVTNGQFAAFDNSNGTVAWSYQCMAPIPIQFAPVIAGQYVFVVDIEGHLYAFSS